MQARADRAAGVEERGAGRADPVPLHDRGRLHAGPLSLGLAVQVQIPNEVGQAIEQVADQGQPPEPLVVEIDQRPLSSFGCDGIVMSTPTGSTAYSFSAGGPVVWPSVEALLLVPLSAHALFARPLVINPNSLLAVEVMQRSAGHGVLWCDGRRTWALPPGARVEVRKSDLPVRLARFRQGPFTDRLVRKFSLPVDGWRGPEAGSSKA